MVYTRGIKREAHQTHKSNHSIGRPFNLERIELTVAFDDDVELLGVFGAIIVQIDNLSEMVNDISADFCDL